LQIEKAKNTKKSKKSFSPSHPMTFNAIDLTVAWENKKRLWIFVHSRFPNPIQLN